MKRGWLVLSTALLLVSVGGRVALSQQALPLDQALKKAQADGKYQMLLRQIKVPQDFGTYGEFKDVGFRSMTEWAGFTDLPKGYWVYAYPHWYIWRDVTTTPRPNRNWGPEQATGEPDTAEAGDIVTAWASAEQDNQDEWLLAEYAEPIQPNAIKIYETYNPGAVYKISVFKLDGEEVVAWTGKDPTPPDSGKGVSTIPLEVDFKTSRVKVYLASRAVPGWNEIDAIGLADPDGKMQWARAVAASTTYAERGTPAPEPVVDPAAQRLQMLEEEVQRLKEEVRKLKELVEKSKPEPEKK